MLDSKDPIKKSLIKNKAPGQFTMPSNPGKHAADPSGNLDNNFIVKLKEAFMLEERVSALEKKVNML
jgi:hypothetical protein